MPYVRPSPEPKPARAAYPSDLTDAEWLLLEPLLPVTHQRGQPRIHSYRDLVDGILYVLRGGNPWRAMPHDLPPWQTVSSYFRDWTIDGTWKRIHDALMEADRELAEREPEPTAGVLDSQTVRTTERGVIGDTMGPNAWVGASATSSSIATGG
jgi:transposase